MIRLYLAIMGVLAAMLLVGCATFHKKDKEAEYEQVITGIKLIERVPITVSYQGGAIYRVQVNNTLSSVINLVWDESVYVNTKMESIRVIHLHNKNDILRDSPSQQASSPIGHNAQFQADFIGEGWLDCARRGCAPQPKDVFKKARLYLSFNIKGKRVEWEGEITFVPPKQP